MNQPKSNSLKIPLGRVSLSLLNKPLFDRLNLTDELTSTLGSWKIGGYHEELIFKYLEDAKAFCRIYSIEEEKIYESYVMLKSVMSL